jgi:hypothetical protein
MQFEDYIIGEHLQEFLKIQIEKSKSSYLPVSFFKDSVLCLNGYYDETVR